MLHLGARNLEFEYVMGGQVLKKVESEKDVGVMVHQSLLRMQLPLLSNQSIDQ